MEYRAGGYARENPYGLLHNLVLVGGPAVNKVINACPLDRTDNTPLDLMTYPQDIHHPTMLISA